jgi:hypothetical protein
MIRKLTALALLGGAIVALTLPLAARQWTPVPPAYQLPAEVAFASARFSDLFP